VGRRKALKTSYKDEDTINKCECFYSRMVEYMNLVVRLVSLLLTRRIDDASGIP
jgi:hypothetical protein